SPLPLPSPLCPPCSPLFPSSPSSPSSFPPFSIPFCISSISSSCFLIMSGNCISPPPPPCPGLGIPSPSPIPCICICICSCTLLKKSANLLAEVIVYCW